MMIGASITIVTVSRAPAFHVGGVPATVGRMSARAVRALATIVTVIIVASAAGGSGSAEEFVRRHWRAAPEPQRPAPARFSTIEASVRPEAGGTCETGQEAGRPNGLAARATARAHAAP